MQLSEIDFSTLERVEYSSKHVDRILATGAPRPRDVYRDGRRFYKLWGPSYSDHRVVYWRGRRHVVDNQDPERGEVLLGHLCGLYDERVCPAFIENVYDGDRLAGYVTEGGTVQSTDTFVGSDVDEFVDAFIERSLASGFVFRDLKARNIIRLDDGRLSLIDLDTPLVSLNGYSASHEQRSGSLARFTLARYRNFIHEYLNAGSEDENVRRAQVRFADSPPRALRVLLDHSGSRNQRTDNLSKDRPAMIPGIRLPSGDITEGKRSSRSLRRRNAIVACSFELEGKRVLDIGCADGLHSMYMAKGAREVVGIDHRMTEIAAGRETIKALGFKNVTLECGDVRDPELFKRIGKFDLAVAWGFLHRVSDLFSLLYNVAPLADALSLEWRTPVLPLMSAVSLAYHPSSGRALDPMNIGGVDAPKAADEDKIEGGTAFWEPTPGAVIAITRRLGFVHSTLLGYGERLESENKAIGRHWNEHLKKANAGKVKLEKLPEERVHMLFEKTAGSVAIKPFRGGEARLPDWDHALIQRLGLK